MSVYSHRMMSDLYTSLDALADTFFCRMPLILTPDEFIAGFIAPEHVPTLREVEELVGHIGTSGTSQSYHVEGMRTLDVIVAFGQRAPIILPRYVSSGFQPTCPDEVRQKVLAWVKERVEFGYAFGDAYDALNELNEICADTRAMAAMLPCFTAIMAGISDDSEAKTTKRAQHLSQNKSVGRLPRLPRQVKDRLLEVSAIVNSVSLMKDAPIPETPKHHARLAHNQHAPANGERQNIFRAGSAMKINAAFR